MMHGGGFLFAMAIGGILALEVFLAVSYNTPLLWAMTAFSGVMALYTTLVAVDIGRL